MKVLVVGSSRCLKDQMVRQKFKTAGQELGKALADRGHTILIGTDEDEDIDPHIVRGALKSNRTVEIQTHVAHGSRRMFTGNEWTNARVKHHPHQFTDWDVTAMEVIRNVDGVLTIGGKAATVHAGVSAWMMGKAVIPIGSFGGGAKAVWDYGSASRSSFYNGLLDDLQIDRLAAPWDGGAERVVDALERVAKSTAISGPWLTRLLWLMAFAMTMWIVCLIPWGEPTSLWQLFPAAVFAGLLGAGIQTLRMVRQGTAVTSQTIRVDLGLGLASGLITAMLFLLAQIGVNGKVVVSLPSADYARVTLIASVAALFAGIYLDAALLRFDKVKARVLAGTYGKPDVPAKPVSPANAAVPPKPPAAATPVVLPKPAAQPPDEPPAALPATPTAPSESEQNPTDG